jgi:hypothetical protein
LILDAGAVMAVSRGNPTLRARLKVAAKDRAEVVIPPVVVTQTIRGGPGDAPINQLLKTVQVPPADLELARQAGGLLGATGLRDAADAHVMAEAFRRLPAVVLTSDPEDMAVLAQGRSGIHVTAV